MFKANLIFMVANSVAAPSLDQTSRKHTKLQEQFSYLLPSPVTPILQLENKVLVNFIRNVYRSGNVWYKSFLHFREHLRLHPTLAWI